MAKKKAVKKVSKASKSVRSRYESFKLHGNYSSKQVAVLTVVDLIIGFALGLMLQPTIADLITSYAAASF